MLATASRSPPIDSSGSFKIAQDGSTWRQDGPEWLQDGSMMAQAGPRLPHNGPGWPKLTARRPQEVPRWFRGGPPRGEHRPTPMGVCACLAFLTFWSQMARQGWLRGPARGSKGPPRGTKTFKQCPQDGPSGPPARLQNGQTQLQDGPGPPQDGPKALPDNTTAQTTPRPPKGNRGGPERPQKGPEEAPRRSRDGRRTGPSVPPRTCVSRPCPKNH